MTESPSRTTSARPRPSTELHPIDLTPLEAAASLDHDADRLVTQGNLDGALRVLHKAIYLRPDHAPLHAKLARVYWDLCDLKSAMAWYRKLLVIDPSPSQRIKDQFASLLDLHGFSLLRLGETPSVVIAYLSEAIQLNALDETLWLHRALAQIHAQCFDKALKDVDHCINLNGKDVEYFVLRAKLHWKLHNHEKATQDIQRAARLCPTHPEVLEHERRLRTESETIYAQACRHVLVHEIPEAIKCLTKAAELAPHETKLYVLRASAHRELQDLEAAMRDMDKALSCHRTKLEATRTKQLKIRRNDAHEPIDTMDRTREFYDLTTQRNLIVNDLAVRFLAEQSFQLALNAMNQVIQSETDLTTRFPESRINALYFVHRGDAYRGLGNLQAALADYHHALELGPETPSDVRSRVALIHYNFGIALFNDAQFPKAEVEFAKAIAEDPDVATYHVRKGDAARFQEKHAVASTDYLHAWRLNPHDLDIRNKLQQYAINPVTAIASIEKTSPRDRQETSDLVDRSVVFVSPTRQPSGMYAALQSSKQKHRVVQDLYHNRPPLRSSPPPKNAPC